MEKHESCDCEECGKDAGLSCGCSACARKKVKSSGESFFKENFFDLIKLVISAILIVVAFATGRQDDTLGLILCLIAYVVSGAEIFINCVKGIAAKDFLNENTLMFIASVTAFIMGEYAEGALIVTLYALGELLEDAATDNSRKKIAGLSELKSVTARLVTATGIREVAPETVEKGSLIEVRRGDRVPIDGVLCGAVTEFDMKAITGESKPYYIENGGAVYGGAINAGDSTVIKTTELYKDSTAEKIIAMVEGANAKKAKSQKFISSFAKIYTPIVVLLAVIVGAVVPLFDGMNFTKWIYNALNFLVISCPCALVISVPLAFFTGIGSLAKNGVMVKGSNYIDALAKVKTAAFDKTGTLTKGEFSVEKILPSEGFTEKTITEYAVALETKSNHPVSKAICDYAGKKTEYKATDVKEVAGKGISGVVNGVKVAAGNVRLMSDTGIDVAEEDYYGTVVYVAADGVLAGRIYVCDAVKPEARETIASLKKCGVEKTVMFSGDGRAVCEAVGKAVGMDEVYSKLLPQDKTERLGMLKESGDGGVLFAGDGINDAPTISLADVGVAMGALGSEISIDSADVVIMDDDVRKIPFAIKKAKKIRRKVIENIVGSLAVKAAVMILSVTVGLPVWAAMLGDVGVMLIAVLNSLTAK